MKNADRIRKMTDEELALFLCNLSDECSNCPVTSICRMNHNGFFDWVNGDDFDAIYGDYQDDKG